MVVVWNLTDYNIITDVLQGLEATAPPPTKEVTSPDWCTCTHCVPALASLCNLPTCSGGGHGTCNLLYQANII